MKCHDHGLVGDKLGYAKARYPGASTATTLHRVVWMIHNQRTPGDTGPRIVVRHKCDNPRCINPAHLEEGTHKDNTADMHARGRHVYGKPGVVHSNEKVQAILAMRQSGVNQRQTALHFGVSPTYVSMLTNRTLQRMHHEG